MSGLVRSIVALAVVAGSLLLYPASVSPALAPPSPNVEVRLASAVAAVLRRNADPQVPVVYPSQAYPYPYLRDSFWLLQAMNDRRLSLHVLDEFVAALSPDGNPPTYFARAYARPSYHQDDSAALVLIWSYLNRRRFGAAPPINRLQRVLSNLLSRARGGYFITPAGPYTGWWDAYAMPRSGTLSYDQGLYAVALRCASALGLHVPNGAIRQAERAYRALYDRRLGYMPLGTAFPASDASALSGEFLSLWMFHHPMLPDSIVFSTLHHLAPFGPGFHVMSTTSLSSLGLNGYLPSGLFGKPGDYQNGASWLLYDALTIGAAGLHGWRGALQRLHQRLELEFEHGAVLHEYLQTERSLPYYSSDPTWRDNFSWDAFTLVIVHALRQGA